MTTPVQRAAKKKKEDSVCESTFKLSVRFQRSRRLMKLLPLLALVSLLANIYLVVKHQKEIAALTADSSRQLSNNMNDDDDDTSPVITSEFILLDEKREKRARRRNADKHKESRVIDPQPQALSPNATFSACLLIKDDNEILNEWIAYHYHTVNLRQLVVAVDPLSSESPQHILSKWRETTDLDIVEWNDEQYMDEFFLQYGHPPTKYLQKESDFKNISSEGLLQISNHRYRQRVFLAQCLRKLKDEGSTWTMHIDTDEYVIPSKLFRQVQPDYVAMKPIEEPGSVLNLLQQTVEKTPSLVNYPCLSMMRLLFGSIESEDISSGAPAGFNATMFETLRWQFHAPPQNMTYHGNPKVIIDVSAIPKSDFPIDLVYSIHRPVRDYCHKNKELDYLSFHRQPLAANHYLGSYERYSGRSDKRRSREIYDKKAQVNDGADNGTQQWLHGFVDSVGVQTAKKLLGDQYVANDKSRGVWGLASMLPSIYASA